MIYESLCGIAAAALAADVEIRRHRIDRHWAARKDKRPAVLTETSGKYFVQHSSGNIQNRDSECKKSSWHFAKETGSPRVLLRLGFSGFLQINETGEQIARSNEPRFREALDFIDQLLVREPIHMTATRE